MATRLVDFHCHLDLYPDPPSAIAEADAAGVYTLTVTTTPRAWPRNLQMTRQTRHVRAALGLHPQLVAEHADELPLWERHLHETRYIGEVGLDAGPRFYRSLDQQKQVFGKILKLCAQAGNKILSVHSVRSASTVLDLIESHLPRDRGRVVMHWFTGSNAEARRAAELGCFFSINSQMFKSDRARDLIAGLPADRLLTETDGPFTTLNDRPVRPTDVAETIGLIAAARNVAPPEMNATIIENLKTLVAEES